MLNFKIKKRANQPESEEVHEVGNIRPRYWLSGVALDAERLRFL